MKNDSTHQVSAGAPSPGVGSSDLLGNSYLLRELAEAFLRWPLPDSVCADLCATKQGPGRIGTNLLSYIEARQMMSDIVLPRMNAAAWTQTPPTVQGEYWHWNGDDDSAPLPMFILWSGTSGKCFVCRGQLGINHSVDCDEYGGWWMPLYAPRLPNAAYQPVGGEASTETKSNERKP